jgi:selenoprotein W-related protein
VRERFEAGGDAEVELVKSSGGVFEISVDGKLRFSKKALGRFPEEHEVQALVAGAG